MSLFDPVARRYDLLNRLMSFGLDSLWRKRAVAHLKLASGARVLDAGVGTGDGLMALAGVAGGVLAAGVDVSDRMLRIASAKLGATGGIDAVLALADVCSLPFADRSFDAVISFFCVRLLPDRAGFLSSAFRVLKPNGKLVILELTYPGRPWVRPFYELHASVVIPLLGALLSDDPKAYRLLPRTIRSFPGPGELAALLSDCGFEDVGYEPLSLGVATIVWGSKRETEP
ncbi:MAG TPA: ubiquinone/menaquinone biosynthesis methyltransferase [Proteobacteria bacterium]|nr:ubiquinone/menaquinone biosynthesis methyltransferase [Pseudomonadota bacterium]